MDRTTRLWLLGILSVSLVLNLWGIDFGLPEAWHPDEIVGRTVDMARRFSLNPHEFRYGSLHFYQVLAVIVPTYLVSDLLSLPEDTQKTLVYLAARSLSAVLGTGCVAFTFLCARQLFDARVGLLAALFLALTMGLVNIAHFATVDAALLFWMMASFFMAARVWRRGDRTSYLLAGLFAGLAAATKYPGGVVILSLVVAHLLGRGRRDWLGLLSGLLASTLGFIVVNPMIFLASCEFFEGFIRDNAYTSMAGGDQNVPLEVLENVYDGLGAGLSALVGGSLLYGAWLLARKESVAQICLIGSITLPLYLVLAGVNFSVMRFVIPLLPPLLILAAKAGIDLIDAQRPLLRRLGAALILAVTAYSSLYTVSADLEVSHDSRNLAVDWIAQNVPAGSTVEATSYTARLPEDRFAVVKRPHTHSAKLDEWVASLERSPFYRLLQPVYLAYKGFAEAAGICEPRARHYVGWYDRVAERQVRNAAEFDPSIAGLEARAPDVLMISSEAYDRFANDRTSPEGRFYAALFAGESSYRRVARINYQFLPWPRPEAEFINPTIEIWRRER